MKTTIDMAREVYGAHTEWSGAPLDRLEQLVALVRADERGRMCEQLKECSSEKPTSNEANRSEVLGESGQAN
jgi:hypothetical protein